MFYLEVHRMREVIYKHGIRQRTLIGRSISISAAAADN